MDPQAIRDTFFLRLTVIEFVSVLEHLWIPVIVIGTSGTAAMIRRVRANLLDELRKPYVTTARAKGVPEFRGLIKYPGTVQLVIGPLIETKGLGTAEINRRTEEWIETTMEKLPDKALS